MDDLWFCNGIYNRIGSILKMKNVTPFLFLAMEEERLLNPEQDTKNIREWHIKYTTWIFHLLPGIEFDADVMTDEVGISESHEGRKAVGSAIHSALDAHLIADTGKKNQSKRPERHRGEQKIWMRI